MIHDIIIRQSDEAVTSNAEQLVKHFSEKSLDQYIRVGYFLFFAVLFYLQILVAHRNFHWDIIVIIVFFILPVFL